ncbi:FAD-dependent oxidoreductase [Agromyces sp. SYSU T00266]|uniref:FAD-dependent oxidoreductase n=1 Tax=Agromyces zhanjiangensis TaxID=3158562 RepID=UPI003399D8DA
MRDVIIVGAGPVGVLLAADLSRRGLDVEVLERREAAGRGSRAVGVHPPVLAALEPSGVTERLLDGAVRVGRGEARAGGRVIGVVRFDRLAVRFPFVATQPQHRTEAALAVGGPEPVRGATVLAALPRPDHAVVRVAIGGRTVERRGRIVVVAAGAAGRGVALRRDRATARDYGDRYLMADAEVGERTDAEVAVVHLHRDGVLESFPLPGGTRRFVAWDPPGAEASAPARVERLRRALAVRGEADAAHAITEATAFGVRRFVSPSMRRGRVLVVGDAAHEVSPIGGQGMNLGLLDAATLAPLLARWIDSGAEPGLALERWERRRVASSQVAARLAGWNTALGRPRSPGGDAVRRAGLQAGLAPPLGALFARAYAMGFDRDALPSAGGVDHADGGS